MTASARTSIPLVTWRKMFHAGDLNPNLDLEAWEKLHDQCIDDCIKLLTFQNESMRHILYRGQNPSRYVRIRASVSGFVKRGRNAWRVLIGSADIDEDFFE